MKQALIIGINGGFGGHVARALQQHGWRLRALLREPSKLSPRWREVETVQGSAAELGDVERAAEGCELIVYGANIPYPRWHKEALPLFEPTLQVAQQRGLTIVFPGNVYIFDPADGPLFDEQAPAHPVSRKGAIRVEMERRLRQACEQGARAILLRCGDFIGAHSPSTWIEVLRKRKGNHYELQLPGPAQLPHSWAFLPDVGETVARLVERRDRLPAFAPFHFPGYRISFRELAAAMEEASGRTVKTKPFPWWMLNLAAPFVPFIRELNEMRYLWQQEVNLDGRHLMQTLDGELPNTPLPEALLQAGIVQKD